MRMSHVFMRQQRRQETEDGAFRLPAQGSPVRVRRGRPSCAGMVRADYLGRPR